MEEKTNKKLEEISKSLKENQEKVNKQIKETIQDLKTKIETCRAILQRPLFLHCMAVKILSDPARYYLHLPHRRWLPSPLIVRQTDAILNKDSG